MKTTHQLVLACSTAIVTVGLGIALLGAACAGAPAAVASPAASTAASAPGAFAAVAAVSPAADASSPVQLEPMVIVGHRAQPVVVLETMTIVGRRDAGDFAAALAKSAGNQSPLHRAAL